MRKTIGLGLLAFGWIGLTGLEAQTPPHWETAAGGKMAFDVASVRPDKGPFRPPNFPLDAGDSFMSLQTNLPPGGRLSADFPLVTYIQFAYKLWLTQEQRESVLARLPKWVGTDRFDIEARAEGNPTKDQMRLMMQSLLADRFKLAVHFETQVVSVFALTLVKPGKIGPKLHPHAEGPPCDAPSDAANSAQLFPPRCDVYMAAMSPEHMYRSGSRKTTLDLFASFVPSVGSLGRPVVNQTGLNGEYDFQIEWAPEPKSSGTTGVDAQTDTSGPTFLDALREQLGLKLESTKAPVEILVIDHVELPSEN
ncbi:MAG TPA: TIGR03435 family protein [Bryobacteraceae bacterium]|jgi:uncharacterized protein (TIGR03435 family)|nr:TIGR03435 family protein [Bryobacteraceae bacterium]